MLLIRIYIIVIIIIILNNLEKTQQSWRYQSINQFIPTLVDGQLKGFTRNIITNKQYIQKWDTQNN